MNLFKQVKPIEEIKEEQEKTQKKVKKLRKRKTKQKQETGLPAQEPETQSFNNLEFVDEIKESKLKKKIRKKSKIHKAGNQPQPYEFSSYKNNIFSLYLNCDKFYSQKPYYQFSQNKTLFLSNDEFNDFFDVNEDKLILNIDDFNIISRIVKMFENELKEIKYIKIFEKNIPKEYFLNKNFKTKERRCEICPFFNLENCTLS